MGELHAQFFPNLENFSIMYAPYFTVFPYISNEYPKMADYRIFCYNLLTFFAILSRLTENQMSRITYYLYRFIPHPHPPTPQTPNHSLINLRSTSLSLSPIPCFPLSNPLFHFPSLKSSCLSIFISLRQCPWPALCGATL